MDSKLLCHLPSVEQDASIFNGGLRPELARKAKREARDVKEFVAERENYHPKLTKQGYFTSPPMEQLSMMTLEDLQTVQNFSIFNVFGKVEFESPTDVTFQDLDEAVKISHGSIEVYPDEEGQRYHIEKPAIGTKLNKPAKLYYFRMNLPNYSRLSKRAWLMGATLTDYIPSSRTMAVTVEHFTKFEFKEDDEDSLEDADVSSNQKSPVVARQEEKNLKIAPNQSSIMRSFSLPMVNAMDIEGTTKIASLFGQKFIVKDGFDTDLTAYISKPSDAAPKIKINNDRVPVEIFQAANPKQTIEQRPAQPIENFQQVGLSPEHHSLDFDLDSITRELQEFNFTFTDDHEKEERVQLRSDDLKLLEKASSSLIE